MNTLFTSNKNYLKRDTSTGYTDMAAPTVLAYSGYIYSSSYTVNHNLGYIPQVRVYFENSASDGKVYPAGGRRLAYSYTGLNPLGADCLCLFEVSTTSLTIYLESNLIKTGTRRVYWVIYRDSP